MKLLGGGVWLDDMLNRKWEASETAKNGTSSVLITRVAALDIYVCGFLCTPFSSNGLRQVRFGAGHGCKWFALVSVVVVLGVFPFDAPSVSRSKHRHGRTKQQRRFGPQ
jgi:hypothetical protein